MSDRASRAGRRPARTVALLAAVAVVSLVAGLLLSQVITSPNEAAADAAPPAAGPITVPVESRVIANDVVVRGAAQYDGAADVGVATGGDAAIVTGRIPEIGSTLDSASVALEVGGRPVILLPGDLPAYRSFLGGAKGPDVEQLENALAGLGLNPGPVDGLYDASTAAAVQRLYAKVGYDVPDSSEKEDAADAAREAVRSAETALTQAQDALTKAKAGLPRSAQLALDQEVATAQQALADAQAACTPPADPTGCSQTAIVEAQYRVDIAIQKRKEDSAAPDTSSEQQGVTAAQSSLADARTALADAVKAALTPLPLSEVIFVSSLPRRVDDVTVARGDTLGKTFMTLSGATLELVAKVSKDDAALLTVGQPATVSLDGGEDIEVTIESIDKPKAESGGDKGDGSNGGGDGSSSGDSNRLEVTFALGTLTDEQLTSLRDSSVRIKIPVSSTDGEVLAVPLAALTAGPGGESRVERVVSGDKTELITVTTGLAAKGYVEITSSKKPLAAGDLVVVGTKSGDDKKKDGDTKKDGDKDSSTDESTEDGS